MSKYDLLLNGQASQTAVVPQFQSVTPAGPTNPNMPPLQQTFELELTGVGAVSASAQIIGSNDTGPDPSLHSWVKLGDPITATGTNTANAFASMTGPWRSFAAYLTAISGTGASANVKMSA